MISDEYSFRGYPPVVPAKALSGSVHFFPERFHVTAGQTVFISQGIDNFTVEPFLICPVRPASFI